VDLSRQSTLVTVLLYTKKAMALAAGRRLAGTCYQLHLAMAEAVVELCS
jgi:hypothetical protein